MPSGTGTRIDHRSVHRVPMPVGRALGLGLLSAGAGAASGLLAALALGAPGFMNAFGAVFGGGVGLLCAPAMIWAAWHERTLKAAAIIVPPAAFAAWAGGLLTPANGGPQIALGLSVSIYLTGCYLVGRRSRTHTLRLRRLREHACVECGYSLRGLPSDVACPECGTYSGIIVNNEQ
jgi:hypothetical protein